LFKELTGDNPMDNPMAYKLRHFMRTFVLVAQNGGFCIRNDKIFITNSTPEQKQAFERSQNQSINQFSSSVSDPSQSQPEAGGTVVNSSQLSEATEMLERFRI